MTRISEAVECLEALGYTVTAPNAGPVANAHVEPVIRESVFGAYYDFGFRNARTVIVGTRVNGNFQPRRIMLPHQLYVRDVEAMVADGATEIRVHPICGEGFIENWVEVPRPASDDSAVQS